MYSVKFTCFISMSFSSRNHPFDQAERRRSKARRRLGELTSDLDAPVAKKGMFQMQ